MVIVFMVSWTNIRWVFGLLSRFSVVDALTSFSSLLQTSFVFGAGKLRHSNVNHLSFQYVAKHWWKTSILSIRQRNYRHFVRIAALELGLFSNGSSKIAEERSLGDSCEKLFTFWFRDSENFFWYGYQQRVCFSFSRHVRDLDGFIVQPPHWSMWVFFFDLGGGVHVSVNACV